MLSDLLKYECRVSSRSSYAEAAAAEEAAREGPHGALAREAPKEQTISMKATPLG